MVLIKFRIFFKNIFKHILIVTLCLKLRELNILLKGAINYKSNLEDTNHSVFLEPFVIKDLKNYKFDKLIDGLKKNNL